jgi:UDP-N-acetylglucosamine 2-epimerase (non-hydrolysing)
VRLGAGLRNRDWIQPDEVDRTVADRVADTLLATNHHAVANLLDEGVPESRILDVGATRVDLLRRHAARAQLLAAWRTHGLIKAGYVLVSLEASRTVGPPIRSRRVAGALRRLAAARPVLLVRHAGTRTALEPLTPDLRWTDTGTYTEWLSLLAGAGAVITDSGAVQEESSALGVRCQTLASSTARTVTLTHGTNALLGDDPSAIVRVRPATSQPEAMRMPGWDGEAAERVAEALTVNYALTSASGER